MTCLRRCAIEFVSLVLIRMGEGCLQDVKLICRAHISAHYEVSRCKLPYAGSLESD